MLAQTLSTYGFKLSIYFDSIQDSVKLSKTYSKRDKEFLVKFKEPSLKYPPIENLHEYLQSFQNCFVYIRNYRGIDILPTNVPIVLSEIETLFSMNTDTKVL